ncbi:MAG: ECF-type sigma factor [Planctomycetota bacterium]
MDARDANPMLTVLLAKASDGDDGARSEAYEQVYGELRRLAQHLLAGERAGHTLQTTALVNEAAIKLLGQRAEWVNREQFFAVAATAMRRILVDHARARAAVKRGGGAHAQPLSENTPAGEGEISLDEVLALDELLSRLEEKDARKARVVELRYFAGMDEKQIAAVLGVARSTVSADWSFARAWLAAQLRDGNDGDA